MPAILNAHQLGRLIDRTIDHIGDEYTEPLHGIRLDADATHLYAVASDRHTLAAARYRHHGLDSRHFACTIPAASLRLLREWAGAQPGSDDVTLTLETTRLRFAAPAGDLRIVIDPDLFFPDWRGVLRGVLDQTRADDAEVFPVVDARLLARFQSADDRVRVRATGDFEALLVVGQDFLGAQMPRRNRRPGLATDEPETPQQFATSWQQTLAGSTPAPMTTLATLATGDSHEVTKDIGETVGALLRQAVRSSSDLCNAGDDPKALAAHAMAGINAWSAYRFLDALYNADPLFAAKVVAEVAGELDSGEIGAFAFDAAEQAGHNPRQWQAESEAAATEAATR